MNTGETTNKGQPILQGARRKRYFVNARGHHRYIVNRPVPLPPIVAAPPAELPSSRLILYSGTASLQIKSIDQMFRLYERFFRSDHKLPQFFTEVSGRKQGFKTVATITNEYGIKPENPSYGFSAVTFKLFFGDRAHAVTIFRNGKITFTGGYPVNLQNVEATPRRLLANVFPSRIGTVRQIEIKSVTAQVYAKYQPERDPVTGFLRDPQDLKEYFDKHVSGATFTKQFAAVQESGMSYRYYMNGTVQISGIKSQEDFKLAKKTIGQRVRLMIRDGLIQPGGARPVRRPTRPQKRFGNQAAPDLMTRSTTCPKNRMPVPYSFGGRAPVGYYVSANPQGQPCCYKIPQRKAYLKPKIIQRFASLGLRIPESTKQIFGIDLNNSNKPVNVSGHVNANAMFVMKNSRTGIPTLKIGTRQALRYSMTRLLDIARRLGVALDVRSRAQATGKRNKETRRRSRMSKANVAVAILDWARTHGKLKQHTNKMLNAGRVRLGPGGRLANTYSKQGLINAAARAGIRVPPDMRLAEMINYVKARMS